MTPPDSRPVSRKPSRMLWDTQWTNCVNHARAYDGWTTEDAVAHAVKMAEDYIRANVERGEIPASLEPRPAPEREGMLGREGGLALDLRNALLQLSRVAPGMLETVDVKNDGVYGDGGPDGSVGFLSYALVNSQGDTIADTLNSGHVVVEEVYDDEGERIARDDIGERNSAALAACWNFLRKHGATIEATFAENERLRAELDDERKLSTAISRDCNECANQRNAERARADKAEAERDELRARLGAGTGWRLLEVGEVVQESDEILVATAPSRWREVGDCPAGYKCAEHNTIRRRFTNAPARLEAGETVAWQVRWSLGAGKWTGWRWYEDEQEARNSVTDDSEIRALYTHPTQHGEAGEDRRDALRYRWMRGITASTSAIQNAAGLAGETFDTAIDAAIATTKEKGL